MTALEAGILAELNDVRAAHGLRPLKVSSRLTAAARQHTFEMLADGYFEHESVGRVAVLEAGRAVLPAGPAATGWSARTCSGARPSLAAKKAVELWMGSPGHRKNILTPSWREIGISAVYSSTSTGAYGGGAVTVITTDFGVR